MTPIKSVTSVQAKKDGFFTKVTVYASGNDIVFRFRHDPAKQFVDVIQALLLAPVAQGSAPPPPDGGDLTDQIRKLGELRDQGLLTADEFEAKKSELLSRI